MGKLKTDLSHKVMHSIAAGAIHDQGVRGLAETLHISERHLRRIVRKQTGSSPLRVDTAKRLEAAKWLITGTNLPITDIAFTTDFSSLRQFNGVFKHAFNMTPRTMRRIVSSTPVRRPHRFAAISLAHLVQAPLLHHSSHKQPQGTA